MFIHQATSFPFLFRFQALVAALTKSSKPADSQEHDVSVPGLDPHLRYDIGEIDHRPCTAAHDSYESWLWLHHYPR